jgi:hypothetical protein
MTSHKLVEKYCQTKHLIKKDLYLIVLFLKIKTNSIVLKNLQLKKKGIKQSCFTKEDIGRTNKHLERYSASLTLWEAQIKTTLRYHCMPITIREEF